MTEPNSSTGRLSPETLLPRAMHMVAAADARLKAAYTAPDTTDTADNGDATATAPAAPATAADATATATAAPATAADATAEKEDDVPPLVDDTDDSGDDTDDDPNYVPPKPKSPTKHWNNRKRNRKQKQPKRSNQPPSREPRQGPPKMFRWKYIDPETNETHQTGAKFPGPIYDTVFKRVYFAQGLDPLDSTYVLLDDNDTPKRSKCHLRACTKEEYAEWKKTNSADCNDDSQPAKKKVRKQAKKRRRRKATGT